jgi:hypothetical protein
MTARSCWEAPDEIEELMHYEVIARKAIQFAKYSYSSHERNVHEGELHMAIDEYWEWKRSIEKPAR